MICPNCGKEIKEVQKFCTSCGTELDNIETIDNNVTAQNNIATKIIAILICFAVLVFVTIFGIILYLLLSDNQNMESNQIINNKIEENIAIQKKEILPKETKKSPSEILDEIKSYQAKYWEIITRHDMLLELESDDEIDKDFKELNSLFKEVTNKIDSNNRYLKRYYEIEKEFENNTGENTVEMNDFASRNYNAVLGLINDVYKTVKSEIPEEDFIELRNDERKWLKEVNAYQKVFDDYGFGTIGTLVAYNYEINMQNFRALLLMLYL